MFNEPAQNKYIEKLRVETIKFAHLKKDINKITHTIDMNQFVTLQKNMIKIIRIINILRHI